LRTIGDDLTQEHANAPVHAHPRKQRARMPDPVARLRWTPPVPLLLAGVVALLP
jgi:hypothetical protein